MKIRALVAKMDGVPAADDNALAPGCIKPTAMVPVTQNFDRRLPPIGHASLIVDGTDVYAEISTDSPHLLTGRYPAIGFIAKAHEGTASVSVITDCDVREVSICAGNSDQRIPPISN